MTEPALEVFSDREWPRVVATRWASRLSDRPDLVMCLPTGHTPRPVYRLVTGLARFGQSTIVLLDEFGGLPAGHPARCESTLRRDLVDGLDPPPAAFHAIDVDARDVAGACREHSAIAREKGLGLVILGLGRNGHLGLNEPGTTPQSVCRTVALTDSTRRGAIAYGATDPPTWGATLGLSEILAAEEIWLLVTGADKTSILRATLDEDIGPHLPSTYLRMHDHATVIADRSATDGPHRPVG